MSGWWQIEITTPKIMKGRYKISGHIWAYCINYEVYVDNVFSKYVRKEDPAITTSWGEFYWEETERHKVKIVAKSPGLLFWDTIIFTPL